MVNGAVAVMLPFTCESNNRRLGPYTELKPHGSVRSLEAALCVVTQ